MKKTIKRISAFAIALLMLIPAIMPTSAYVFESMDEYKEFFTDASETFRGSYAWVSITNYGGTGTDNNFLAKTVFVDAGPVGVFTGRVTTQVSFVINCDNEVIQDCDCKTAEPYAEGIESVVDGSEVDSDYTITFFSIHHIFDELFTNISNQTFVTVTHQINGATTS
ncbi:MAG: hypothetical protein PUA74_00625 [Clostridiales bacterium]|nr:hypothetical protein [Clostridiales bacterium]HCG68030.1 hypothetical protein [Clostridiales bacterium]